MKVDLFGEVVDNEVISVEKAAEIAKVSVATIRNWIKTGYLTQIAPKLISYTSFATLMNEVVSIQKLNKRANKLHKKHFFDSFFQEFAEQNNSEVFAQIYENSLTEAYRNQEGIYYTPAWIVEDMLNNVVFSSEATFLEPCCGTGNFIIEAIKRGANPENIYAYDTDSQAIAIAKSRIQDMFGVEPPHIQVGDFLKEAQKLLSQNFRFDFIFTNPPWGKKITKQQQKYYANSYQSYQSHDTSVLFLFACLQLLKEKGTLGFLMQEAFANISSYEHARSQVLRQKILRITDYGRAFPKLLTSAYAFILQKKPPETYHQVSCELAGKDYYFRKQSSFSKIPKKIFNFWAKEADVEVLEKIYSIPHLTLQNHAEWALGIVTGNNEKFCSKYAREGYIPVWRGSDITCEGLKPPTTFIPNDFNLYQQVAPREMYFAKEKLIYRFISSRLLFFYDDQQRAVLNSANLLIPSSRLGITTKQLAQLLNSEIMNWVFQKIFHTHKILRGDLEMLPLHTQFFQKHSEFSETAYWKFLGVNKTSYGTFVIEG